MQKKEAEFTGELPVLVSKSDDFRTVYADGAIGGANPYDFRLIFYHHAVRWPENPQKKPNVVDRILHTEVILSFKTLVELRNWLDRQIKGLEKDKVIKMGKPQKK